MIWDYYIYLAQNQQKQEKTEQKVTENLTSDSKNEKPLNLLLDTFILKHPHPHSESASKKAYFLGSYISKVQKMTLKDPGEFIEGSGLRPNFSDLPSQSWLGIQVDFELLTPWYSKDDRVFNTLILDNSVRKDRVFSTPFMSATSWKGLLRWACRMRTGLKEHFERGKNFKDWEDPDWILHLFGNEKGKGEDFHQGSLVFYPTWFDKIGFEVINPHDRKSRAGIHPIHYEVVPVGANGTLYLLYAPWPGMKHTVNVEESLLKLLEAIKILLTTYGISAKRTVGWGTAKIKKWKFFQKNRGHLEVTDQDPQQEFQNWFKGGDGV
ncbi:RAMP superfamily CRISPR-associated protein [Pseudothermotoga sp.]|uniref:RAMP superfamily CRISPR-associated protein n=1 Tax=Pseudothermotoga sp. TaxID=2033661 RepID=UPI0031F6B6B3